MGTIGAQLKQVRLIEIQTARIGVICTLGKPSKSKTLRIETEVTKCPATACRTAGAGDTEEIQRRWGQLTGDTGQGPTQCSAISNT